MLSVSARYKCAGIGLDTDKWHLCLADEEERMRRYRAALSALSDYFLSPQGALTATMLPHLTALQGAIVLRTSAGRAPIYSGLVPDFIERLGKLADDEVSIFPFETIDTFHEQMQALIHHSIPALPCVQVEEQAPLLQECIVPLRQWINSGPLHSFYSCILSEFQDISLSWEDFLPDVGVASRKFLRLEVYLWPMTLEEQRGSGKVLVRMPFPASPSLEEVL